MAPSVVDQEQRVRLEKYPDRFRVRLAGRVMQIRMPAADEPPHFEALIEVEKSRPLPPVSVHALSGIPMVEVIGDDLDEDQEVTADDEELDQDTAEGLETEEQSFPQYRVFRHESKPAPLYPDYPPMVSGTRVRLVWHGQHSVPGIIAGTSLRASGMLTQRHGRHTIYNPRYEIVP